MPAQSLVLFDIDGTLMRGAGQHHKDALVEGIHRVTGSTTTLDGIATAGMLDRDLISAMLRTKGVSARSVQRLSAEIIRECQTAYANNCNLDLKPFVCRGVRETLAELQVREAALGLVTGNLREIGWRKMELAGLRSFFSVGAFSEDGRTRARLAKVAAQRARREKLIGKNATISLVGDHTNDVLAAKANGFRSIAVATGVLTREELRRAQPDLLVEHLEELTLEELF